MKRMLLAAGFAALVAFAGCKSLPTVQEQFNTACPIVTADLKTLSTSPLLPADQQAAMAKAATANADLCTAGAALNVTNLKAFHDSLLPAAIAIVQGNPLIPDQTVVLLALNTFGPMVQQIIDQLITTATSPSAASAASASAPVAASQ
jgi:hypothetical protein